MKRLLVALIFVFISVQGFASTVPKKSDRGFVVDMACKEEKVCLLSAETRRLWTTRAQELQDRTGVQAVLLVVHGTGSLGFEEYANQAANDLKVGTRNNGGLVLLFDNVARKVRLEVSRDLEGVITDVVAREIILPFTHILVGQVNKGTDYLAQPLSAVFDAIDHYATQSHSEKGGKRFIAEQDKSFTYFVFTCLLIVIVSSLLAVLWYSRRWYYTTGSLLGGALCTVAGMLFSTVSINLVLVFFSGFVTTYILAFLLHRVGDSFGWGDVIDALPTPGGGMRGMVEGVADFAGGGASEKVASVVSEVANAATNSFSSCNTSGCDVGSCDGCDIGGCDL